MATPPARRAGDQTSGNARRWLIGALGAVALLVGGWFGIAALGANGDDSTTGVTVTFDDRDDTSEATNVEDDTSSTSLADEGEGDEGEGDEDDEPGASQPTPSTTTPGTAPPSPEIEPITAVDARNSLLTNDDLPDWAEGTFTWNDDLTPCGIPAAAAPIIIEGRSWSQLTDAGVAIDLVNAVTVYATEAEAIAVFEQDANLENDCPGEELTIAGVEFAAGYNVETGPEYQSVGAGEVIGATVVLLNAESGVGVYSTVLEQRWGRTISTTQLVSNEVLPESELTKWGLVTRTAFERAAALPQ